MDELTEVSAFEVMSDGTAVQLYGPGDRALVEHVAFDRSRHLKLIEVIGEPLRGRRVLDLGANPYILTYALLRLGAEVTAGGHPRTPVVPAQIEERVDFRRDGELVASVPLKRFNVEEDPAPFADATFDVVVCGELIEHLPRGPELMLHECNRVLREGGLLLMTTPNAVSLARILSLIRGTNVDWPFSEQGIYARHNRTYTPSEITDLLIGNGFRTRLMAGLTFPHRREWYAPSLAGWIKWSLMRGLHGVLEWQSRRLCRLSEGLLVAATKVEEPRLYRPDWLFRAADTVPLVAQRKP